MAAAVSLPGAAREALIALDRVSKDYDTGGGLVRAMREVSLTIAEGELVAIVGTSGSGKSTVLRTIMTLEPIDGGEIDGEGGAGAGVGNAGRSRVGGANAG